MATFILVPSLALALLSLSPTPVSALLCKGAGPLPFVSHLNLGFSAENQSALAEFRRAEPKYPPCERFFVLSAPQGCSVMEDGPSYEEPAGSSLTGAPEDALSRPPRGPEHCARACLANRACQGFAYAREAEAGSARRSLQSKGLSPEKRKRIARRKQRRKEKRTTSHAPSSSPSSAVSSSASPSSVMPTGNTSNGATVSSNASSPALSPLSSTSPTLPTPPTPAKPNVTTEPPDCFLRSPNGTLTLPPHDNCSEPFVPENDTLAGLTLRVCYMRWRISNQTIPYLCREPTASPSSAPSVAPTSSPSPAPTSSPTMAPGLCYHFGSSLQTADADLGESRELPANWAVYVRPWFYVNHYNARCKRDISPGNCIRDAQCIWGPTTRDASVFCPFEAGRCDYCDRRSCSDDCERLRSPVGCGLRGQCFWAPNRKLCVSRRRE